MKKLFGGVLAFLVTAFKNVEVWISDHIKPAIEVVNQIKTFVDDSTLDVLTQFIHGDIDDKALAWLRKNASNAIDTLAITAGITNEPDFLKKVKLLIAYLRKQTEGKRNELYLSLATAIARKSANAAKVDGRASVSDSALRLTTELQFQKMKSAISDADGTDETANGTDGQAQGFYSAITGGYHKTQPVVEAAQTVKPALKN